MKQLLRICSSSHLEENDIEINTALWASSEQKGRNERGRFPFVTGPKQDCSVLQTSSPSAFVTWIGCCSVCGGTDGPTLLDGARGVQLPQAALIQTLMCGGWWELRHHNQPVAALQPGKLKGELLEPSTYGCLYNSLNPRERGFSYSLFFSVTRESWCAPCLRKMDKDKPRKNKMVSVKYVSDFIICGHKLFFCSQN